MKLITKKNIIPVICIVYTFVSITLTIYEIIAVGEMNPTQLNIFIFLLFSIMGVLVLSQHYRLERFSPLAMVLIQYFISISIIIVSLRIASLFAELHPDGYKDMILSFSIPYTIGAVVYYICLKLEVKKQNRLLEHIKKNKKQFG